MKWAKRAILFFGGFFGSMLFVYIAGSFLPREHGIRRSRELAYSPGVIWALIASPHELPRWRRGIVSVTQLPNREGKPMYREDADYGKINYVIELVEEPKRFRTRVVDNPAFGGTRMLELEPMPGGCRITITDQGWIENPMTRFLTHHIYGYDLSLEGYFEDLEAALVKIPKT